MDGPNTDPSSPAAPASGVQSSPPSTTGAVGRTAGRLRVRTQPSSRRPGTRGGRLKGHEATQRGAFTFHDVPKIPKVRHVERPTALNLRKGEARIRIVRAMASVARPSMPPSPRCRSFGAKPGSRVTAQDSNAKGCSDASFLAPSRSAGMPSVGIEGSFRRRSFTKSTANAEMSMPHQRRFSRRAASTVVPQPQNGSNTKSPSRDEAPMMRSSSARASASGSQVLRCPTPVEYRASRS